MMRYYLALLLCLLFLSGCAGNVAPDTIPTTDATTIPEETIGCYVENSDVEKQTNGAVRLYDLPGSDYSWIAYINDHLMLFNDETPLDITTLAGAGDQLFAETADFSELISADGWQNTYRGIVFYNSTQRKAMLVDTSLQTTFIELPELDGKPVFAPDCSSVYYCKGNEIRVMDVDLGIDRMLKTHSCASQTLLGAYFDGKILTCRITDEAGQERTIYVSAQTGETLHTDNGVFELSTYDDLYFAMRKEGIVTQRLYGTLTGAPKNLILPQETNVAPALALGGAVSWVATDSGFALSFYDFETEKKTAEVTVQGTLDPMFFAANPKENVLWFIATDADSGEKELYCWNIKASSVQDDTVCVEPYYNRENPDAVGLELIQDRVDALNKQHGVDIRIWQDAVKKPGSYMLEPEHQTVAITECLDELESVLANYPEDFLYKSVNRWLRICIVRNISGEITGVQYWDNGDAYIVLAAGCDFSDMFAKLLGYVVDSHVLGNSPLVDDWQSLNPEGFVYGQDENTALLEGEGRAFADTESMMNVSEERSRLFYYAMLPDNREMFASVIMQSKLKQLCLGIRDAWRWEKKTDVYPWEQYLSESIAYVK